MKSEDKSHCKCCAQNIPQRLSKGTGINGNQRTNQILRGMQGTVPKDWVRGLEVMKIRGKI